MRIFGIIIAAVLISTTLFAGPPETFRDLMYTKLSDKITAEDAAKSFLLPKRGLFFSRSSNPIFDIFRDVYPYDLVEYSLNKRLPRLMSMEGQSIDPANPVTVIMMPGLFSEFLTHEPFESVLQKRSAFRDKWEKKFRKVDTKVYDIRHLKDIDVPLSKVARLGSFDDGEGRPLIRMIYMRPLLGSLGSIGHVEKPAKYLLERITQVLDLLKSENTGRLYIFGYSWGVPLGFEILSKASQDEESYPWIKDVKGFVSVAGVIYGAVLADILDPFFKGDLARNLNIIKKILDGFDPLRPKKNIRLIKQSLKELNEDYFKKLVKIVRQNGKDIKIEGTKGSKPFEPVLHILNMARKMLEWNNPIGGPKRNVERAKLFAKTMVESNYALLTSTRMNWWRKNTIPSHIKYYTVSAVHKNPTDIDSGYNPMREFPYYGPNSNDGMIMRLTYYLSVEAKGSLLNDGAVTISQSNFRHGLYKLLNFRQRGFKHRSLGVMTTHHLGVAIKTSLQKGDEAKSLFPRREMFESLFQTVSMYE